MHQSAVEPLYQAAMNCAACFAPGTGLHLPTIDVPQPRWVGSSYHTSSPRVLVVMLNPGQGDGPQLEQNLQLKALLHRYKGGQATFSTVLAFQHEHMRAWGRPRGRFLPFYTTALGLSLDALAFINIALCATKENQYPAACSVVALPLTQWVLQRRCNRRLCCCRGRARTRSPALLLLACLLHALSPCSTTRIAKARKSSAGSMGAFAKSSPL